MPVLTQQLGTLGSGTEVSAFLFTDVIGSSKLYAKYGILMERAMDTHEKQVNRILKETQVDQDFHGNHLLVKWIGDAVLIEFETLSAAVYFAMRLQEELMNPMTSIYLNPESKSDRLLLRVGIAYGPAFKRSMIIQNNITVVDFFGNTLNTASRMESKVSTVGGFAVGLTTEVESKGIYELENLMKSNRIKPLLIWSGNYSPDSDDSTVPSTVIWKWDVQRFVPPGTACQTSGPGATLSTSDPHFTIQSCRDATDLKGVAGVLVVDYIPIKSPL
jgi:class 3 adenylate cyclase